MSPIENLPNETDSATHLLFTPNSAQLVVALRDGGIQILNLLEDSVVLSQYLDSAIGNLSIALSKREKI